MCLRLRERWHLLPYVWGDAPVCVCSSERLFIFLLHEQKKNETKRKFAGCIFLPTPALFYAKQKELASLKQLFVFNAPKSTCASRQKKEAGTRHFQSLITYNSKLITQNIHFPSFHTA